MLTHVDLANRPDFDAGPVRASPARRLLEGPGGSVTVEPIVMKVLLVLLDADGKVVTRNDLFTTAWGGVFVGDDSLNRAIARVRKSLSEVAPGSFEIETIPRTGYRLTGEGLASAAAASATAEQDGSGTTSRRTVIGSAVGLAVAGSLGVGLWAVRARDQRRFGALVQRGVDALEYGDGSNEPARYLREAVDMRPEDGAAQGLLAYALMANADNVNKDRPGAAVNEAEAAANASLSLTPNDPNARLARIQLQRATLDLAQTEDRLRAVLKSAPNNIFAMRLLWNMLQSAGRSSDALAVVERAMSTRPLAASNNFPLAQLLWIVGRAAEAERIIDRAMQMWPEHRYVRFARFTIYAFTGRARAALAMIENENTRPQNYSPAAVAVWKTSLAALDRPSAANIAKARDANLSASKADPRLAAQAVLTLSALGLVDAAFEISNDVLLFQTPAGASSGNKTIRRNASSLAWRFTPWLFTPPAAPMRADPRFETLADGIGLTAYWAKRGLKPDYQRS